MSQLLFYRQGRFDGGIRTGVRFGDHRIAEQFVEGDEDYDPMRASGLDWFIDLNFEGDFDPPTPDAALTWLDSHSGLIGLCLEESASEIPLGSDVGGKYERIYTNPAAGVDSLRISCASTNRFGSQKLGELLAELATEFSSILNQLERLEESDQPWRQP